MFYNLNQSGNSVDPNKLASEKQADLDLHCFQITFIQAQHNNVKRTCDQKHYYTWLSLGTCTCTSLLNM